MKRFIVNFGKGVGYRCEERMVVWYYHVRVGNEKALFDIRGFGDKVRNRAGVGL